MNDVSCMCVTETWFKVLLASAPQLVCNLIINVIRNIISLLHNIKLIFLKTPKQFVL